MKVLIYPGHSGSSEVQLRVNRTAGRLWSGIFQFLPTVRFTLSWTSKEPSIPTYLKRDHNSVHDENRQY